MELPNVKPPILSAALQGLSAHKKTRPQTGPGFSVVRTASETISESCQSSCVYRRNHTHGSCLAQPTRTVTLGHGSPPFHASEASQRARGSWPCPTVAGVISRVTVGRGSGGDSHRHWVAGLSKIPLLARRRALTPGNAFPGTMGVVRSRPITDLNPTNSSYDFTH